MGFPKQEYWSGLPFPSPGDLLKPGIEPESLGSQAGSLPGGFFATSATCSLLLLPVAVGEVPHALKPS